MASKSISSNILGGVAALDIKDPSWLRVDLGDLGGVEPREVLTAVVTPRLLRGTSDPDGQVGDLIPTYWAALFLMSDLFRKHLETNGITGWQALPVSVTGNWNLRSAFLLQVTGRCGPIISLGVGRGLDVTSLDGTDVFVPSNEATVLLSDKAASAIKRGQLRNVEVTPAGLEPLQGGSFII